MLSKNCWTLLPFTLATSLIAQMSPNLSIAPVPTVKAAKGSVTTVTLKAQLPAGYHANSNKPSESYLIPLTLKWTAGPLQMESIIYPKPASEKYSFSEKPLSVVTGDFSISTKFKVPAEAASGPAAETGILRFQACDDKSCYPPKNVPVNVTVNVE